ncbi:MAG: hypothetical protein JWO98_2576 [Frankiales bacterium]|nr:hypothetical protein [Frankiales bacterium]
MDPSTGRPPPTLSRAEVLRALSVAFSEPRVLVDALQTADSDDDAVDAICRRSASAGSKRAPCSISESASSRAHT